MVRVFGGVLFQSSSSCDRKTSHFYLLSFKSRHFPIFVVYYVLVYVLVQKRVLHVVVLTLYSFDISSTEMVTIRWCNLDEVLANKRIRLLVIWRCNIQSGTAHKRNFLHSPSVLYVLFSPFVSDL